MEVAFRPGEVLLGKYRVDGVLGRGGMGVVLRVTHVHLGEELAIKLLLPEAAARPEVATRFLREAQSVVRLRGEHVTRVSDVGILPQGVPYIVMEYLHGSDLAAELHRRRVLPSGEAVDYALQACEALAEAHTLGIVHRDIKAANLFLTTRPDGTPLLKVLDFGISKVPVSAGAATRTDIVMGTPGYMSPEQMKASRDVDARTDIWALGIVLYECLCGRRPFDAESFSALVLMAATEPPPPMDPRLPRGLQAIVLRCLQKERTARFSSIAELAAALAPFARDQRAAATIVDRTKLMRQRSLGAVEPVAGAANPPIATTLSGSASVAGSRGRRRYVTATVTAVGTIALVAIVGVIVTQRRASSDEHDHESESVRSSASQDGGRVAAIVVDPGVDHPPSAVTADVAIAPPAQPDSALAAAPVAAKTGDDKAVYARCTDLYLKKEWQGLDDCATELAALGLKDRAKEFHDQAVQETTNEANAGKVRQALRDGNLKEAQASLRSIGEDSVYARPTRAAFTKAETQAVDEARRKAMGLVTAHDCQSLKNLYTQHAATSTERVAAAVGAFKCVPLRSEPATPKTQVAATAGSAAGVPPQPPAAAPSAAGAGPCDTMNVEEAVQIANAQYSAGYVKAALVQMQKALNCKQDARMYRFTVTYACAAHDLATAKQYFAKVPPANQPNLEQKCQQEGLNVRGP